MKVKLLLAFIAGAVFFLLLDVFVQSSKDEDQYIGKMSEEEVVRSSPAIQMYFYIKKFSKKYGVPEAYAFAVAYQETRYQGPLHTSYTTNGLISYAGAVGPMQIIPQYAHAFAGRKVSARELQHNIKLNVEVSMKMLRKWHQIYRNWPVAFGAYNTGMPVVNEYAKNIINKRYHWRSI